MCVDPVFYARLARDKAGGYAPTGQDGAFVPM